MKNFIQTGQHVTLAAPYALGSGEAFIVGALFGVALTSAANGGNVEAKREGVFKLPKATGQTWAQGDKLYWDATNKKLTTTASGNTLVGAALIAAASGDTTGTALLPGSPVL